MQKWLLVEMAAGGNGKIWISRPRFEVFGRIFAYTIRSVWSLRLYWVGRDSHGQVQGTDDISIYISFELCMRRIKL